MAIGCVLLCKKKKRKAQSRGKAEKYNIEKKKMRRREIYGIFFLVVENGKYTYSIEQ
jgi:hypothetical protein